MTATTRLLIAAVTGAFISGAQFKFFDCNEAPALSFIGGVLTITLLYAAGEMAYWLVQSARSTQPQVGKGLGMVLAFGGLAFVVGFFTLITHTCP
jgi:hypothetical protein